MVANGLFLMGSAFVSGNGQFHSSITNVFKEDSVQLSSVLFEKNADHIRLVI